MSGLPRVFRRSVKDIPEYLNPKQIVDLVENAKPVHYKTPIEYYRIRDRALLALLCLTGLRIGETLRLERRQFDVDSDAEFIIIRDVEISKRRKDIVKIDVPLPKVGVFEPLTMMILDYLTRVKRGRIFKIKRCRAWRIINDMTGKWPHYFRSQRISFLVNKIRSAVTVSRIMGIKSLQTVTHYYKSEWNEHRDALK